MLGTLSSHKCTAALVWQARAQCPQKAFHTSLVWARSAVHKEKGDWAKRKGGGFPWKLWYHTYMYAVHTSRWSRVDSAMPCERPCSCAPFAAQELLLALRKGLPSCTGQDSCIILGGIFQLVGLRAKLGCQTSLASLLKNSSVYADWEGVARLQESRGTLHVQRACAESRHLLAHFTDVNEKWRGSAHDAAERGKGPWASCTPSSRFGACSFRLIVISCCTCSPFHSYIRAAFSLMAWSLATLHWDHQPHEHHIPLQLAASSPEPVHLSNIKHTRPSHSVTVHTQAGGAPLTCSCASTVWPNTRLRMGGAVEILAWGKVYRWPFWPADRSTAAYRHEGNEKYWKLHVYFM